MRHIAVLMLLLLVQPVSAFSVFGKNVNIIPDSPLWKADIAVEKAKLVITRDPTERAELRLHYIEERLEEMNKSSDRGIAKAINNYEENIVAIEGESKNMLHGHERVIKNLEAHKTRAKEKKQELLAKVDEDAKDSIEQAFDDTIGRIDEAEDKIKESEVNAHGRIVSELAKYNDVGFSVPEAYNQLTKKGTVKEDTTKKAVKYINDNYNLEKLEGKAVTVEIHKEGNVTSSYTFSVTNGVLAEGNCCAPTVLKIDADDIPGYTKHILDDDKDKIIMDLISVGGKDLVSLIK